MPSVAEHERAVRALLASLLLPQPLPQPLPLPQPRRTPVILTDLSPLALSRMTVRNPRLAADVRAPIDLPPFDNSQMDGYAVRCSEVLPDQPLFVGPPIAAGSGVTTLAFGEAAPIMTGAPMPVGADAIIPIELATPAQFPVRIDPSGSVAVKPVTVSFATTPERGAYLRPRGSDVAAGSVLLASGTILGPAQWAIIAAAGITAVEIERPLRVLVLSTGDELCPPGTPLKPGQIYDANGTALALAVADCNAEVVAVAVVADDAAAARRLLAELAPGVDLVLSTGGASKGAYEVVRDVFDGAGVEFGEVAVQPGGPQGFGMATLRDSAGVDFTVAVVAFPGNPVSALVSFELFLRPILRELHGLPSHRAVQRLPLVEALDSPPAKHQLRRGRIINPGPDAAIELIGGPSSHLLHGYATATVLVHVPVGVSRLDVGDTVEVWSIND